MTSILRGEGGGKKIPKFCGFSVHKFRTKGEGVKNPKKLRTSYVYRPQKDETELDHWEATPDERFFVRVSCHFDQRGERRFDISLYARQSVSRVCMAS